MDEELADFGILKHTLQPVIENYIVHGIHTDGGDNLLDLRIYKEKGAIHISIEDNGKGIPKEKLDTIQEALESNNSQVYKGIGLMNVHERIMFFFGSEYGLKVKSSSGLGTVVTIKIPAIPKGEMERHVQGLYRG